MKLPRLTIPRPRPAAGARLAVPTRRLRAPPRRWAAWGTAWGAALALLAFAPATWLAGWVEGASGGRLLLADSRGSVWSGSAVTVLAGGTGSQDARALPGRLSWTLRLGMAEHGPALLLRLDQSCCLRGRPTLSLTPGLGTLRLALRADERNTDPPVHTPGPSAEARELGRWPAAWLVGLGTPWNTLDLGGVLQISTPGIALERTQGRWRIEGGAALELRDAASRVATLDRLGSYRLDIGDDPGSPGSAALQLSTLDGPLRLSGTGSLGPAGLHFRGEATAAEAERPALANLLNIIGRRDGARSVIAIG